MTSKLLKSASVAALMATAPVFAQQATDDATPGMAAPDAADTTDMDAGIGKKLVAVEMSSLDVAIDEAGSARLTNGATKADLEAAEQMDSGIGDASIGTVPEE